MIKDDGRGQSNRETDRDRGRGRDSCTQTGRYKDRQTQRQSWKNIRILGTRILRKVLEVRKV